MNDEKFTKISQELTEKFKNSIPENETELIEPFQNFKRFIRRTKKYTISIFKR